MWKLSHGVQLPQIGKKTLLIIFSFILVFSVGGIGGVLGYKYLTSCKVKYTYINESLGCGIKTSFDKSNPIALKNRIISYVDSEKVKNEVSEVSVYFRDLKDGPVFGINEDDLFISASLLKLPIAVTVFRLSEDEIPDLLDKNLLFQLEDKSEKLPEQFFKPSKTIEPGQTYTVSELISRSLIYSDNWVNEILKIYLGKIGNGRDLILQTFKELGLVEPASLTTSDISTRGYASIFRILFNASYLSREDSEKILSVLSQSEFDRGITAGVPDGVRVTHKFGERNLGDEKQLHDCGIIYYPNNPYLLCVMTRGQDFNTLSDVIKQISGMVYKEMELRSKVK